MFFFFCFKPASSHNWFAFRSSQYRSDFNAAYIKTLFKHCKTQHYVAEDGTLKPITPATQARRLAPAPYPQVLQQPLPTNSPQVILPPQQQLAVTAPPPSYSNAIQLMPNPAPTPTSNISSELSQHIVKYRLKQRAQAELARAQAARAQVAAFSGMPGASQAHANQNSLQAASNHQQLANITAQLANTASTTPTVDLTGGTAPNITPTNNAVTDQPNSSVGVTAPNIASSAAFLQQQNAAHNNAITKSQALAMVRHIQNQRAMMHRQALQQRHMWQMQQMLQSSGGQPQQVAPQLALNQFMSQGGATPASNVPSARQSTAQALDVLVGEENAVQAPNVTPAAATEGGASDIAIQDLNRSKNPQNGPGAALKKSPQNTGAQNGVAATASTAVVEQALSNGGDHLTAPSASMGSTPGTATPRSSSVIHAAPLRGAIVKKSGAKQVGPMMTSITRCELTAQVRKVAERSQNLIFSGTSLFFADAVFQVPSTEEEAMETMRQGTTDVDKDGNGPNNDLYFVSWSHTQFFAAQMAALGYRFLSSNLKRKARQAQPPPVREWLRLEKYQSIPRPLPSANTVTANGNPNASNQPPGSTPTKSGIRPSGNADMNPTTGAPGTSAVPTVSPVPVGTSAPSSSLPAVASGPVEHALVSSISPNAPVATQTPGPAIPSPVVRSHPAHVTARPPSAPVPSRPSVRPKVKEIPIIDLT